MVAMLIAGRRVGLVVYSVAAPARADGARAVHTLPRHFHFARPLPVQAARLPHAFFPRRYPRIGIVSGHRGTIGCGRKDG